MTNQRPPRPPAEDETEVPGQGPAGSPLRAPAPVPAPQPGWTDPDRTRPYSPPVRGLADRVQRAGASGAPGERSVPGDGEPPPSGRRPAVLAENGPYLRERGERPRRGLRGGKLVALLAVIVLVGLGAGGAAAWFSGWRPPFIASIVGPAKPADTKPANADPTRPPGTPPDAAKPGDPPKAPGTTTEIAKTCFSATTEVKPGQPACGFTLDAAGALSFQGQRLTEKLTAGTATAQRALLFPFSPSGRYLFVSACEGAGACASHRLVDTKDKKLFDLRVPGEGIAWTGFSPKEQVGLFGYKDGITDGVVAINVEDGKPTPGGMLRAGRTRYAQIRKETLSWKDETGYIIEVKVCPRDKKAADGRNAACDKNEKVPFRRRLVPFTKT